MRTPDAGVVLDLTGKKNGRGAYLCEQVACWERALYSNALSKALHTSLTPDELLALREFVSTKLGHDEKKSTSV